MKCYSESANPLGDESEDKNVNLELEASYDHNICWKNDIELESFISNYLYCKINLQVFNFPTS